MNTCKTYFWLLALTFQLLFKAAPAQCDLSDISYEEVRQRALAVSRDKLAFPGAEGFGAYSQGGNGGKILHVTTLKDNNEPGSLRWAINQDYPRIVVFDVEGIIVLNSTLPIENPFITIDGSTAPGNGVTIKDGTVTVKNTHDVIIRYLKVRPGDEVALKKGIWKKTKRKDPPEDSLNVNTSFYVIIDHCSASWCSDEVLSVDGENITVQNCFITEPLGNPELHIENGKKQSHPFAALVTAKTVSYIKNLLAYFRIRGPQLTCDEDGCQKEAVNNYVCAFSVTGSRITLQNYKAKYHIINNFYDYLLDDNAYEINLLYSSKIKSRSPLTNPRVYIAGNIGPHRSSNSKDQWACVKVDINSKEAAQIRSTAPLFTSPINVLDAKDVPQYVLTNAGAILPQRDPIDQRIINQLLHKKGEIIQGQDDVGGYKPLGKSNG